MWLFEWFTDTGKYVQNKGKIKSHVIMVTTVTLTRDEIMWDCSFQMMLHYNIANYKDVNEFLALLARRQGRLKKHGVPDVNRAAKMMLQDWNLWVISHSFSQCIYRYGIM